MKQSLVTFDITAFMLSDHDNLIIKPVFEGYVFSHIREGSKIQTIGTFNAGKWKFNDIHERTLFLQLLKSYPKEFRKAFKRYFQTMERPKFYTIICARRKFIIWQQRLHSTIWDTVYNIFYAK